MTETALIALERLDNLDNKGWDIDFRQLLTPQRGLSPYIFLIDKLYESPDQKYACLFYTVTEFSMGSYSGLVGLFENKGLPRLIVNPKNQWFKYESVSFSDNYLFLKMLVYDKDSKNMTCPYIVIDLDKKEFGFIDLDWTSIYYSLVKKDSTRYFYNLDSPKELENRNLKSKHGDLFDLKSLEYYSIDLLNRFRDLYCDKLI